MCLSGIMTEMMLVWQSMERKSCVCVCVLHLQYSNDKLFDNSKQNVFHSTIKTVIYWETTIQ